VLLLHSSFQLLNSLKEADHRVLLAINHARTPTLDAVMTFASQVKVWFPFYAVLLGWLLYHFRRRAARLVPLLAATVALADSLTSRVFKPWAARPRPCHAADLAARLYLPDGCGGQFGFMSSHAANSMGLAVFLLLTLPAGRFRALKIGVFLWALLISYSRVYLAAHYPLDVLGGWLVGATLGAGAAWVFRQWDGVRIS